MNKLTNKQKRSIKRKVNLDLGINPPKSVVYKSKKIYTRKIKYKPNTNEDG